MKHTKPSHLPTIRILAAILCFAVIISISGCSANSEAQTVTDYMVKAWTAVGSPFGITQAYHYHFKGGETIEAQAQAGIKYAFRLSGDELVDNGHIFYFIRNTDYQYYVLMDESGKVLSKVDMYNDSKGSQNNLDLALRMLMIARFGICSALAPQETHREPNHWHQLTEKQLKKIQ